ncbi:hypothetical protein GBF35_41885 [Nonomuraea phyllanthi]|uniref:hypothetical protein n=1 Tax=Nonomuraea phyllanthi TaxID=2219224 RepID=UPI001293770A|nr:hypothetical protein [Nonomuraea phyllanthi]QFY12253.1 hypothetical protein GBF35_41885 [Nonomuraea phyllanthi]
MSVHKLVKDVAPFGLPDEQERLQSARSLVDFGLELRTASGEIEPAARHVFAANKGSDVAAFQVQWEGEKGPRRQLVAGSDGALLTGLGTMAIVVVRIAWKAFVIYVLAYLAVCLLAALMAGPAREFVRLARIMGARRALALMRKKLSRLVETVIRDSLHRARKLSGVSAALYAIPMATWAGGLSTDFRTFRSDEEARRITEDVLRETPAGRQALAWAKEHRITVLYQQGSPDDVSGAYYDDMNVLRIFVGGQTAEELAATFVHEVNHARNEGKPNPLSMGREEYIRAAIEEEVDGEVKAHEMRVQLAAARGEDWGWASTYGMAYRDAVSMEADRRRQQGLPELSANEIRRIGDEAGRDALREHRFLGYPERFEQEWISSRSLPSRVMNTVLPGQ